MSKTQLIEEIRQRNLSAAPDFLAQFTADDLAAYLRQPLSAPGLTTIEWSDPGDES